MANTQDIAERIKKQASKKGVPVSRMLEKCGVAVSTVGKMSRGKDVYTTTLATIATELDVSTDYLLGLGKKNIAPMNRGDLAELLDIMTDDELDKVYDYAKYLISERETEAPSSQTRQE